MADDGSTHNAIWPLPTFAFTIDLGDGKPLRFSEISGLDSEVQTIQYRHGESKLFSTSRMPELSKVGNVRLKNGLAPQGSLLLTWIAVPRNDAIERRTVTISLLDEKSTPTMTWSLTNAFPVKLTVSALTSDDSDVAIEALEIAYETLAVKAP